MLQPVAEKIVEGKMAEFCEKYCLLEQPFIKDQTISISRLIASKVGKLGENITVRRFARFKVGEGVATAADNRDNSPEGGDEAGVPVKKPQGPKSGSGFAAAKLGEESE
jgi:elongation factor Ts